jgi:pimeloyl-ACP methyl ester carboxylesterase
VNQKDSFFQFHQCCKEHNYNLLTFDGPGQGEQLIYNQIKMTTDWNLVISPLLDQLMTFDKVDSDKITLLADGWGGLFAIIAASHDERISSLVLTSGAVDPLIGIERFFPDIRKKIDEGDSSLVNTVFAQAMCNRMLASKLKLRMLAHGVDSSFDLLKIYHQLNLTKHAQNIRCPTLIFECPDDPLLKDQAKILYDLINSSKKTIHCCHQFEISPPWSSIMTSGHQSIIFDWLDELIHQPI